MSEESPRGAELRIGKVRGVTLTKWQRVWAERLDATLTVSDVADDEQLAGLRDGSLDMCFVRLPIDRDGLHAIPLYDEQMVAWVSKEHVISAVDEVHRRAPALRLPLLVLHGSEDTLAPPDSSRRLYEEASSTDKQRIVYPGMYHEIFNEVDRARVLGDLTDWIDARVPGE